jgi:hypothetical protein
LRMPPPRSDHPPRKWAPPIPSHHHLLGRRRGRGGVRQAVRPAVALGRAVLRRVGDHDALLLMVVLLRRTRLVALLLICTRRAHMLHRSLGARSLFHLLGRRLLGVATSSRPTGRDTCPPPPSLICTGPRRLLIPPLGSSNLWRRMVHCPPASSSSPSSVILPQSGRVGHVLIVEIREAHNLITPQALQGGFEAAEVLNQVAFEDLEGCTLKPGEGRGGNKAQRANERQTRCEEVK